MTAPAEQNAGSQTFAAKWSDAVPGIALSAAVAVAGYFVAPQLAPVVADTRRW